MHRTSVNLFHGSLESMACNYAVYACHYSVSKLRGLASALEPCKQHAPRAKATGDDVESEHHVPDDADDDSDHGDSVHGSHSDKEARFMAGKPGKRKRDAATESSSTGGRSPRVKKASISLSSVFRISAVVPLLQQQWQEQKEGQHRPPDLGASAAAFCLADVCGIVGKGASGHVFAARYA